MSAAPIDTATTAIVDLGRSVARSFLLPAIVLLLASLCFGLLLALYYTPLAEPLNHSGLRLYLLRPLHTGAAMGWIYFAGMAMAQRWLFEHLADRLHGERALAIARRMAWRARLQQGLWIGSALVAAYAYATGHTTGREYLEYPPWLAVPILAGWLLFAANFAAATRFALGTLPVYAWMWGTSVFLFVTSFLEANAWLLDVLRARPVRDMAIQWQAMGSLVGSFNLLVYGSVSWLATRMSADATYARSNTAWALFLVGILNSFTNYGHHTYHLPQGETMKWVSFVVSMSEIAIFAKVAWDCAGLARKWTGRGAWPAVSALLIATTAWTALQLLLALVISVPPLNVFVHGTLAIPAHSMGTLIGIDTMAMLAVGLWLACERFGGEAAKPRLHIGGVVLANAGLLLLWSALLWVGIASGIRMARSGTLPWAGAFPNWLGPTLLLAGALLLVGIGVLVRPLVIRHRPSDGVRIAPP